VSIPRLLGIIALLLFIVFVATFFTVLVRLSRIGVTTERQTVIESPDFNEDDEAVFTHFDLITQDNDSGRLRLAVASKIDLRKEPFSHLVDGQEIIIRIENLIPELKRNVDLRAVYRTPPEGDNFINIVFGAFDIDVLDRRDFYPFDGYEVSFNYAFFVTGNEMYPLGQWCQPKQATLNSLTNMIFLNPRYGPTVAGDYGFRTRVAHLRILQYLTATLILIEVLFIIYLLTIVNLQDLMAKGLGYLVGLYIIRNIIVTNAPQFPTLIDYCTLFLICIVFFLMLFKFLPGEEEHALVTLPAAWREALTGNNKNEKALVPPIEDLEENDLIEE